MSAARPTDAFDACLQAALQGGRGGMQRMAARAVDRLRARIAASPDLRQRQALEDAVKQLMLHQAALADLYPEVLLAQVTAALAERPAPSPVPALQFGQLELMGEEQVQESVEVARAQHAAEMAAEAPLAELNGLVCAARGLPTVSPGQNPFRPEVHARALRAAVARFELQPQVRLHWMQALGEGLGAELREAYVQLAELLRQLGVQAAAFGVRGSPGSRAAVPVAAPPTPAAGRSAAPPARPGAARPAATAPGALTLERLHRLVAGEMPQGQASGSAAPEFQPSGFAQTVPAALDALQSPEQVRSLVQRMTERVGQLDAADAGEMATLGWGAAISLEVVAIMVDALAGDARLAPPVQEQLRALEPALRRLALRDPRFFSDPQHPARRLLEAITVRGLAFGSVRDAGLAEFLAPLEAATRQLAAGEASAANVERTLEALQAHWDAHSARERARRERAVQALLEAEQRHLLVEKIAADIRARPDAGAVPPDVLQFACGPWAQVIAHARLHDRSGVPDPHGYLGAVGELMWSAQPELASRNRSRLARIVPGLLKQLREGLGSIGYPAQELSALLDRLMALHQAALLQGGRAAPRPPEPLTRQELEARLAAEPPEPWLAPQDAQDSGLLGLESVPQRLEPAAAGPAAPGRVPQLAELEAGQWLELVDAEGLWRRLQLTWCSPHGRMFMFTGPRGETLSMTRRVLEATLSAGGLRLLSGRSLVDGALDAVAQHALRNSVDTQL